MLWPQKIYTATLFIFKIWEVKNSIEIWIQMYMYFKKTIAIL